MDKEKYLIKLKDKKKGYAFLVESNYSKSNISDSALNSWKAKRDLLDELILDLENNRYL